MSGLAASLLLGSVHGIVLALVLRRRERHHRAKARIREAMTENRLYQRPGLTLAELADEVAATPHEVSQS